MLQGTRKKTSAFLYRRPTLPGIRQQLQRQVIGPHILGFEASHLRITKLGCYWFGAQAGVGNLCEICSNLSFWPWVCIVSEMLVSYSSFLLFPQAPFLTGSSKAGTYISISISLRHSLLTCRFTRFRQNQPTSSSSLSYDHVGSHCQPKRASSRLCCLH